MQGYYPGEVNQNPPPSAGGFANVNYNNNPYPNQQPNPQMVLNSNMNFNYNPNNIYPNTNPQMNFQQSKKNFLIIIKILKIPYRCSSKYEHDSSKYSWKSQLRLLQRQWNYI